MKLVKPSFSIIEQGAGLDGLHKHIELAGRTCYKSEDKITPDSARGFVERMIKSGHGAMLEHGTVYLKILESNADSYTLFGNKYSKSEIAEEYVYITTNLRVLVETGNLHLMDYLCTPTKYHEKRISVKFVCDRGVSHEFVRHRVFSFAQESTRYCNYTKDKFGNELTFIIPCWCKNLREGSFDDTFGLDWRWCATDGGEPISCDEKEMCLMGVFNKVENCYQDAIARGWSPQQARTILPNAIKTELIMTGFVSDWQHFFDLRALGKTGAPHPQAAELAIPLYEEFKKRYLI